MGFEVSPDPGLFHLIILLITGEFVFQGYDEFAQMPIGFIDEFYEYLVGKGVGIEVVDRRIVKCKFL